MDKIEEKLLILEQESLKLEPDFDFLTKLNNQTTAFAFEFIKSLKSERAFISGNGTGEKIKELNISDEPTDISVLLKSVKENIVENGLNPASGGHLGYIPGGGVYPAALGDYTADIINSYAGIFFGSAGAVRLENMLIRWMCKIIGFPETALGNLTSGGSIANQIAIVTARDKKLTHSRMYDNAVIYLTEQVHHSVTKSIRIAGLRDAHIRHISTDNRFKMNTDELEAHILNDKNNGLNPFMVVGSAGTTDTGAIDPFDKIADIAQKHDLWFHIDGAYGGFFVLIEDEKIKFSGIERADSMSIDPHKGLFLPYGLGAVLIKDIKAQKEAHYYIANYMQDAIETEEEPSPADLSPELTKPFRGLRMWFPLKIFGLSTYKKAIEEKLWLCRYFYNEIQKIEGMEVGPYPELSVCIWRYTNDNEVNRKLAKAIQEDGRVFFSSTTINGEVWMRIAVLSFRTHKWTIDRGLEMIRDIVRYKAIS